MEIVAALRVRNEARWIKEVVESVRWCKVAYLMDDHSDDGTVEIAGAAGAVVMRSPFDTFDEARDKEWLVEAIANKHKPGTWVLMIDGDEVLDRTGEREIRRTVERSPRALAFSLRILYLWDSRKNVRVDGVYGRFRRPSLFVLAGSYSFKRTGFSGNLHCRCVPAIYWAHFGECRAALLHLGYMDKADRIRKWKYYNGMDPVNRAEGYDASHPERGNYPHIVQGDIPEVPANAVLKHAGPLRIRSLADHIGRNRP